MTCRGTRGCYIMGCRNQVCREANNKWKREYKARLSLAKDTLPVRDCGICRSPIAEHYPYFRCRVSA